MTIGSNAGLVDPKPVPVAPAPKPDPEPAAGDDKKPKASPRAVAVAHFHHIYRSIGDPDASNNAVELADAVFGPSEE